MACEIKPDLGMMELMDVVCQNVDWRFQTQEDLALLQILWRRLGESHHADLSKYRDLDSGYSALHHAVFDRNLDVLLFLLRGDSNRFVRRPMELLYNKSTPLTSCVDHEGLTAAELLAKLQTKELQRCRESIQRKVTLETGRRSRGNSWWEELQQQQQHEQQNELEGLSRSLQRLGVGDDPIERDRTETSYGCEVFTFGSAHHCALGVVSGNQQTKSGSLRPQRVHSDATMVSCASHHTLSVTRSGHLYAFGLGKGGRLGTGDEKPCATPVRVVLRQPVVAIAAAENHSLVVTRTGQVFAFGSNRFGQLGGETPGGIRCSPRRVDELKQIPCIDVTAGAKHSVALSQRGEVYVWGDNSAGQLGISIRNSNSIHKVQRVEALWKHSNGTKAAIAVAASEQSTLALTPRKNAPGNSIYAWGHGNHVPCKVQFDVSSRSRPINPVAISSARYHNVAITSDGEVYTWGMHADALGTKKKKQQKPDKGFASLSAPRLVTGMLSENGGGRAVAVSASEKHTAVVTEEGHLYTWGDTHAQDILGHEGVRWQPDPRRVAGVHRAVAISAAKEHTALLVGTTFPPIPSLPYGVSSLGDLAARCIIEGVDMFNVIPVLIMAERTHSSVLLDYCREFLRRNLDGVLNVAQRSNLDTYLKGQLDSAALSRDEDRDGRYHPMVVDVLLAGCQGMSFYSQDRLCSGDEWEVACLRMLSDPRVKALRARQRLGQDFSSNKNARERSISRSRSQCFGESLATERRTRGSVSERCASLVLDMDLSTRELAEAKLSCLSKEVRAIRKRLGQITKLEGSHSDGNSLTEEQNQKIARRPQLEIDLARFERSIEAVQSRLACFVPKDSVTSSDDKKPSREEKEKKMDQEDPTPIEQVVCLRCDICNITCSDRSNLELHFAGRKHRNRSSQVKQEEKKQSVLTTAHEQQRELVARPQPVPTVSCNSNARKKKSAWNTSSKKMDTIQPSYRLPPPPHPVQALVPTDTRSPMFALQETFPAPAPTQVTKKSLSDIMAEELKLSSTNKTSWPAPSGSIKPLQSPPWALGKAVSLGPTTAEASSKTGAHSLGDFLTPQKKAAFPGKAGWSSPQADLKASPTVSFREIQQQEEHFVSKQDHSYASAGKWFVERKERAGSFMEIQNEAVARQERDELIEEQRRIEQQIYDEIAAKKEEEAKKTRSKQKGKNAKQKKKQAKAEGYPKESQPTEDNRKKSRTRNRRRKASSTTAGEGPS